MAEAGATPASYTPRHLAERILADAPALRGQKKDVTVLFVDVHGSTELAAALGPEEFHQVMDGAFALMLDAVHRWEGTVNQFTGDGIMALFGAPIAHEDHARRACHAALEIQRAIAVYGVRLRQERGLGFQTRLGLNSGPVVVGAIGDDLRMDYTAQGLTTHLAARMQQAADPGTVLVAPSAYRLAEGYFRFRALGPIRLRGAAEAVEAYVLEAEGSVATRLEASLRRGLSPFRGRERELGLLAGCWEEVVRGAGRAVCLVGEPGIGKSRLAYEFQRSLGLDDRVEAAALVHARGSAYFAFRALLRRLAGVEPDADSAATREALHRRLWDLSPDLVRAVPDLLRVLGTPAGGGAADGRPTAADEVRGRVREAVTAWVAAECRRRPRVLLLEDLHWLDPSSEDLLRHLVREASRLTLLILLTSRLPIAGTDLELAGIREIPLAALAGDHVQALIDAQVDPYPSGPRLRGAVSARAGGNPFYVEELVRAFRENDRLALTGGTYELVDGAEQLLPPNVGALIASRVDRLPSSARELLADAAVLGMRFPLAYLRALAASDSFEDDLALLERRGMLDRHGEVAVTELGFRHVLTQEVVDGGLLQGDRRARHRRAAETLERLHAGRTEETCEPLAHHWARSDQAARAYPHLLVAADRAVLVGANREAIGHLQAALQLAGQHPDAVRREELPGLRLKLAGLHFLVGER
jgi:class 3 adenylate cyclase